MVTFYKPEPKARAVSQHFFPLDITDIDLRGRGVARKDGVVWFVYAALPGEQVTVKALCQKGNVGEAVTIKVNKSSTDRTVPACPFISECGGCSLQHMSGDLEIKAKTNGIRRLFQKILGRDPGEPDGITVGSIYGYRRSARISVTGDKKEIHFGFRPILGKKKLVEISECPVMIPALSALIPDIRTTLEHLDNFKIIGHIELAAVDSGLVMLVRTIAPLSAHDSDLFKNFGEKHQTTVFIQTRHLKGKEELEDREDFSCLNTLPDGTYKKLWYDICGFKIGFVPGDFIQINSEVNQKMVSKAEEYLNLKSTDQVLDLFCGLGNFTIPLAAKCAHIYGIEGVSSMVRAARENAAATKFVNTDFVMQDLSDDFERTVWAKSDIDKVLMDPGRLGAEKVCNWLVKKSPEIIVYVSCNPLTMARDLRILLQGGYTFKKWSSFDMFPRTEHVETLVLMTKEESDK